MVLKRRPRTRGLAVARALLALGLVCVAWASLLRPDSLPGDVALVSDKVLHMLGYAALGALSVLSGLRPVPALLLLAAFGLLLELAQRASGYRSFEWADLLADMGGAVVGIAAASIASGARSRRGDA